MLSGVDRELLTKRKLDDRLFTLTAKQGWGRGHKDGRAAEVQNSDVIRAFSIRLPPRSPNLNAYAERFVRSIKSECLAQVIPFGERHLRHAVMEYTEHYHRERNHQELGNKLIDRHVEDHLGRRPIGCRERLGGLLRHYRRAA